MLELSVGYAILGVFYIWLNWHHISWRKPKAWQIATLWLFWAPLLFAQAVYETYYIARRVVRRVKKWWSAHV